MLYVCRSPFAIKLIVTCVKNCLQPDLCQFANLKKSGCAFNHFNAHLSTRSTEFFITAPIFYVNSEPHLGHLYTSVLCDVHSRWQALRGKTVKFTVGTDEHGMKIQKAAAQRGVDPLKHCDRVSGRFQELFDEANISYTDFIRTTDLRHVHVVRTFWNKLVDAGHIYKGRYEGWYCDSDEAFLTHLEVQDSVDATGNTCKVSASSGHRVEWLSEANYMFRLSDFTQAIDDWLGKSVIKPAQFEAKVRSWLREGLPDLSVSRERRRLGWGIPVPGDDTQTIYVWLDALVNYLTVAGYPHPHFTWPPHCHVIGKDILKFHAVYWPAFLMAAGLPLPTSLLCHSHWLHDAHKMSKSVGNVVDPTPRMSVWGVDALRYFLMREGVPQHDANYTDGRVVEVVNSDLVNTFGNLVSRCTSLAVNPGQICPAFSRDVFEEKFDASDQRVFHQLPAVVESIAADYDSFNTHRVADALMSRLRWANVLLQKHEPWHLAKSPRDQRHLHTLLRVAMETLRVCGIALSPITPDTCRRLQRRLGVCDSDWTLSSVEEFSCHDIEDSRKLGDLRGHLYDRIKPGEFVERKKQIGV